MTSVRLRVAALALFLFILTSCGETYRPVATPVIPNPPNPAFSHSILVINGNGANNPGSSTTIDVSGDSAVSQSALGLMPVHAVLLPAQSVAYVADSLDDTVSEFFLTLATPVKTITLPSSAACSPIPCMNPVFLATTESASVYVASLGDGTENAALHVAKGGGGTVSVISTANAVVTTTIPVGISPAGMAETPNAQRLYVANAGNGAGNGSVTSIDPIDLLVNPPIREASGGDAVWLSPVAVTARSDSARVYVLDAGEGTVTAVDTYGDVVVGRVSVGAGANFMLYDPKSDRLYVSNPVSNRVEILDASTDALSALVAPAPVSHPLSLAVLPDGSRFYVSGISVSGGVATSRLLVFNAADGSLKKRIALTSVKQTCASTPFELYTAAAADSSRVYVGNCDAGNTAIIQTSNDTLLLNLAAPVSAQPPPENGGAPPPQNPVFVLAGP